jgi:hypothetical protein
MNNKGYYTRGITPVDIDVKYKSKTKFPKKIMVWIAISSKGYSTPYFAKSNGAINAKVYSEECVSKRLTKFIQKYHSNQRYVFWPDLAISRYAR